MEAEKQVVDRILPLGQNTESLPCPDVLLREDMLDNYVRQRVLMPMYAVIPTVKDADGNIVRGEDGMTYVDVLEYLCGKKRRGTNVQHDSACIRAVLSCPGCVFFARVPNDVVCRVPAVVDCVMQLLNAVYLLFPGIVVGDKVLRKDGTGTALCINELPSSQCDMRPCAVTPTLPVFSQADLEPRIQMQGRMDKTVHAGCVIACGCYAAACDESKTYPKEHDIWPDDVLQHTTVEQLLQWLTDTKSPADAAQWLDDNWRARGSVYGQDSPWSDEHVCDAQLLRRKAAELLRGVREGLRVRAYGQHDHSARDLTRCSARWQPDTRTVCGWPSPALLKEWSRVAQCKEHLISHVLRRMHCEAGEAADEPSHRVRAWLEHVFSAFEDDAVIPVECAYDGLRQLFGRVITIAAFSNWEASYRKVVRQAPTTVALESFPAHPYRGVVLQALRDVYGGDAQRYADDIAEALAEPDRSRRELKPYILAGMLCYPTQAKDFTTEACVVRCSALVTRLHNYMAARAPQQHQKHWKLYEELRSRHSCFGLMAPDCSEAMKHRMHELVTPVVKPKSSSLRAPLRPLKQRLPPSTRPPAPKKARSVPDTSGAVDLYDNALRALKRHHDAGTMPGGSVKNNNDLRDLVHRFLTASVLQLAIQESLSAARSTVVTSRGAAENGSGATPEREAARLALAPFRAKSAEPGGVLRSIMQTENLASLRDVFHHLCKKCDPSMARKVYEDELLEHAAQWCTTQRKAICLKNLRRKVRRKYMWRGDVFHGDWLRHHIISSELLTLYGQIGGCCALNTST